MRSSPVFLTLPDPVRPVAGRTVFAQDSRGGRLQGRLTGGARVCPLEGCTGVRLGVRWPDGSLTWPCTKGMLRLANGDWELPALSP